MKTQTMHRNPLSHKILEQERQDKLAKEAEQRKNFREMMKKREGK